MLAVIQRVSRAAVRVAGQVIGHIDKGLLVLVAVGHEDGAEDARWLAEKICGLRIFNDDAGKMNLGLMDVSGSLLVVSQFTLYGDSRKGRRPSFIAAAGPDKAIPLYEQFIQEARALGVPVQTGEFGADMAVELVNDGPVTLILESKTS
jgi:D-tyrosyl-tRNA(Tyr) deacylase